MAVRTDVVKDRHDRAIPGVKVYIRNQDETLADLGEDNPLTTDMHGFFSFDAPDGFYIAEYSYAGSLMRKDIVVVGLDLGAFYTDINVLAGITASIATVSAIAPNVTTVAGISGNVTTVAGISGNVTTVAGISGNVTTVAGMTAAIATVNGNATNINTVATNNANVTAVGTNIASVNSAAANMAAIIAAPAEADRAEDEADRAELAADTIQIANYDAYFTPFTDATIDLNNKVIEATDYKGHRYAQPAFGWASEASSANYRVWIEHGAIKVLDRVKAKVTTLTTNVFIRNLRISPDEKSVFYEQFFALGGDWREMHVKINGTGSPAYAFSQKHIVCAGDSLTAGNGSTVGGLYGEQTEEKGIYGSAGYPRALWIDSAFQAAGIKIWNYGFSGAVSTVIADHYVNDLEADKKNWTVLACLGRNNLIPASLILDDFKRIEDAHSAYYKRVFFISVTTRRGAERVIGGVPSYQRGLLDAINSLMLSYVGADRYIDVLSHMIDGSASGALAQAIAAGATGRGGAVITRTSADDTDLAQQVSPDSLMADESGPSDVHYNDAGFQYGWFPVIKAKLAAAGGYI